jgi:primosomal protein N' (replication factor Y)
LRKGLEIGFVIDDNVSFDEESNYKVKAIAAVLDDKPVLSEIALKLAKWISEYYMASIGSALELFSPRGLGDKDKVKVKIVNETAGSTSTSKLVLVSGTESCKDPRKKVLRLLRTKPGYTTLKSLAKELKIAGIGELLLQMEAENKIEIEYGTLSKKVRSDRIILINPDILNELLHGDTTYSKSLKRAPKQKAVLEHLEHYEKNGIIRVTQKELSRDRVWDINIFRALEKKRVIEIEEIYHEDSIRFSDSSYPDESEYAFSESQAIAHRVIESFIDSDKLKPILLYGDTGSGKTLLYIKAIKKAVLKGKQAVLLLPEISLTPQMLGRFRAVFRERVEIFHSQLTNRERFIAWQNIKRGDIDLVIGPRSALFSPLDNLGLIIIDEEHESSYKQDSPEPRYQARDTAVYMASMLNIPIILGSATPSIESMYNAETGKYNLVNLRGRIEGVGTPKFELIDMVEARKKGIEAGHLSRDLADAILTRIDRGEGTILLQNKRGYSNIQECVNCGHVNMCPHCSISLTLHYGPAMLRCHICGYSEKSLGKVCKECNTDNVELLGTGTQLLEDELSRWLQSENRPSRIARLDSDSTAKRGSHEKILNDFSNGEIDVLIGTQMVSKGLDIARVTLVGVVSADMQLYIPDFRGSEKLFQMLVQVGGRAGRRKNTQGIVYIQTYNPREQSIRKAVELDYSSFYTNELEQRLDAGLPPHRRLSKIELSNKDRFIVADEAMKLSHLLESVPGLIQYSPMFTPSIEKVNDRYRRIITVKSSREVDKAGGKLRKSISSGIEKLRFRNNIKSRIIVDIDTWGSL